MSYRNSRFIFRLASEKDNDALLNIMEETASEGKISLVYTRRPSIIRSINAEGEKVICVVCVDQKRNQIAGFGAASINKVNMNGQEIKMAYLFSLRLQKDYIGKFLHLKEAYEYLYKQIKDFKADIFITTVLAENEYAQKMFEKRHRLLPEYNFLDNYLIFALRSRILCKKNQTFNLISADEQNIDQIIEFINKNGKNQQFFPVLRKEKLIEENSTFPGIADFFALYNSNKEIVAAGSFWNQTSYKQYIVKHYNGILKWIYPISSLLSLFKLPELPKTGSVLDFCTISFWAVRDNDPNIFDVFLDKISYLLKGYQFFLIGLTSANPLRPVVSARPHISYKSKIYLVNWQKTYVKQNPVNNKLPIYLECGML